MSETQSVEKRVIGIVVEHFGVPEEKITRETSFVVDLGADSLDSIEVVMEFEEEFDVDIADDDAEELLTVGHVVECVERKLAEEESSAARRTAFSDQARLGHRPF